MDVFRHHKLVPPQIAADLLEARPYMSNSRLAAYINIKRKCLNIRRKQKQPKHRPETSHGCKHDMTMLVYAARPLAIKENTNPWPMYADQKI